MDDIVVHCQNKAQAEYLLSEIRQRLAECGLELHPEKTRIFYCKSGRRSGDHDVTSFDFLGYTFKPREARTRRTRMRFIGFLPAISQKSMSRIAEQVRAMDIPNRVGMDLEDIAERLRPKLVGWINYYGAFYPSAVLSFLGHYINHVLARWAMKKYRLLNTCRGIRTAPFHLHT